MIRKKASGACRQFQEVLRHGDELGLFKVKGLVAAAGPGHTVVCTEEGEVYSFGAGANGILGHGVERDEPYPRLVEAISDLYVTGVATGNKHTVITTKQGGCYTCGVAWYGRLGHGVEDEDVLVPRVVEELEGKKCGDLAAGDDHTVICTEDGEVYTFGYGGLGKLGHRGGNSEMTPRLVDGIAGENVEGVAAGNYHTICRTAEGKVFLFGDGRYGKLGFGDTKNQRSPKHLDKFEGLKVSRIAAGTHHSVFCLENGEIHTSGQGESGQLGHGGLADQLSPMVVEALKHKQVIFVAAGAVHTAVCTSDGEVYTWGSGAHGKLGHGGDADELFPRKLETLSGHSAVSVAAGHNHTVVCTETGEVFTFGGEPIEDSNSGGLESDELCDYVAETSTHCQRFIIGY